jgi:transposase
MMLTDAQWAVLEPLIEQCRPHAKVSPSNLRRTISAILWRHANGAKWRSLPAEFGPWWMAAQTFIRWSRLGVWERLLALVQERGVQLGMTFLDGTSIRAHHSSGPMIDGEPSRIRAGRPDAHAGAGVREEAGGYVRDEQAPRPALGVGRAGRGRPREEERHGSRRTGATPRHAGDRRQALDPRRHAAALTGCPRAPARSRVASGAARRLRRLSSR